MAKYIDTRAASKKTGFAEQTLKKWRGEGKGPPFYKTGEGPRDPVRYEDGELDEWMRSLRRRSTSDPGTERKVLAE